METSVKIFLNKAPFIKLLLPLVAGIAVQYLTNFGIFIPALIAAAAILCFIGFAFLSPYQKLQLAFIKNISLDMLVFALGMFLFVIEDVRYHKSWFGHWYQPGQLVTIALLEKPVEKPNSFKADAEVLVLTDSTSNKYATGRLIVYFKKDTSVQLLKPGSRVTFKRSLQEIKNSGNPGAFDYKRYALFNGITHTVYLTDQDYVLSKSESISFFSKVLNGMRAYVLHTLKRFIPGKKEQGLAEALLIGYKDDLDRDLLQSYTNTGVVHVIAVSGMHLALIFWLLNLLFKPFLARHATAWLHPVLIISILWVFTFIAGGAASIVRAAVMFSCIVLGTAFKKKASVYNTLAASAFLLLCYNPYWLWDAGFQLSYAAVLSIVIFYRPLYNLVSIKNKTLDWIWQLLCVSMAAQVLTTPIALYHFHQFPVYFLITNLLVVPASGLVLIGELILVKLSPVTVVAAFLGNVLSAIIWWMNSFIETLERFPFAVWDGIQISLLQVVLLYVIIIAVAVLLLSAKHDEIIFGKKKRWLWFALASLTVFLMVNAIHLYHVSQQRKMIVYNISKHDAIDFIDGSYFVAVTDAALPENKRLISMHLQPARTFMKVQRADSLSGISITNNAISFFDKRILVVNSSINTNAHAQNKTVVDVVVLAGNPRLYIADLLKVIKPKEIVISGSAPAWKAGYWRKDCDSLQIPCHDVAQKGAFVMSLR